MKKETITVPFESIITGSFLTNDQIKEIKNIFKDFIVVVRCKDCRHATMTSDGKLCKYCAMDTDDFGDPRAVYHDADWFCADGKHKEGR